MKLLRLLAVLLVSAAACASSESAPGGLPSSSGQASASAAAPAGEPQCSKNDDCGWDDPCVPTKCIPGGKRKSEHKKCEESAPEPGRCVCKTGACAIEK